MSSVSNARDAIDDKQTPRGWAYEGSGSQREVAFFSAVCGGDKRVSKI